MKRFLIFVLVFCFALSLVSCGKEYQHADELSEKFITALLIRDEEAMKKYIHPDYTEKALPDDAFYKTLETQFLTIGHPLTNLNVVSKSSIEGMNNAIKCTYVARVNELFYTVELIIVDDENGYGVVSTAMMLNTELDYYYHESV